MMDTKPMSKQEKQHNEDQEDEKVLADGPSKKNLKKVVSEAKQRGYITQDQLEELVISEKLSSEQIEDLMTDLSGMGINITENEETEYSEESQESSSSKELVATSSEADTLDKTDDPVRMYLREMGSVELLSREGEIAIAKRIEAGKDVMINALTQSPLVGKRIFEWKEQIENQQLLVRDIIDIDSTYEDFEASEDDDEIKLNKKSKSKESKESKDNEGKEGDDEKKEEDNTSDDDEFNVSLAKMEEEIKPKIITILDSLNKNYSKLKKYQREKLECMLAAKELSVSKSKNFKKIQMILVDNFKNLQLAPHVVEELVQSHYKENKKIVSLEGVLLRLAMDNKISREEFLKYYLGNEINPKFESFLKENPVWKSFFKKFKKDFSEIRERLVEFSQKIGLSVGEFKFRIIFI
jgi:RNA polymerase primary sigma factor